ncbi:16S rRNA (guanine(527)-N(7))-methyltransferase RsmG [Parafilimonas sp.]|uniref:16S rRNA (guanine(527)-N(7))-methyltransferase RsmG n=1 Tax=Parafilimonas sp. TaxID=1969739 RepID=UPI0039E25A73
MEYITQYFSGFTEVQLKQLEQLQSLYSEWNEKINVISRKDIEHLYLKHVLHALSIAAVFDFVDGTSVIDIGTGGGFPGIPLAIYFPNVYFHLVDSIGKKLKVVEAVAAAIELKNVTVQHIRAEEIRNRKFDFAVSRAVAPLKELWKWSKPLLQKNNKNEFANGLICLKGGDLAQEIFESGLKPNQIPLEEIFKEDYFKEKYMLYVKAV